MTSIKIRDNVYDISTGVAEAKMRDIKYLARATRDDDTGKISPLTINAMFERISKLPEDTKVLDLTDDEDFVANMIGAVWFARRLNREDLSYEDAGDFSFNDFEFISDEDDAPKEVADEPAAPQ